MISLRFCCIVVVLAALSILTFEKVDALQCYTKYLNGTISETECGNISNAACKKTVAVVNGSTVLSKGCTSWLNTMNCTTDIHKVETCYCNENLCNSAARNTALHFGILESGLVAMVVMVLKLFRTA